MSQFYAYLWLREDGTPYYVGKGSGKRAYERHKGHWAPKDRSRILILNRESEQDAFNTEIELIHNWGRKDIGTGCLHNRTNGGENPPNWTGKKHSLETIQKLGAWVRTPEVCAAISKAKQGKPTNYPEKLAAARKKSAETTRGKKRPPFGTEWRAKIGIKSKGRKASLATKEKMSLSHLGRKQTPVHMARVRMAQQAYLDRQFLKTVAWG